MYKYYFKIKKNDTELEFSTNELEDFDKKVSTWVNNICAPISISENFYPNDENNSERMDFIDIKKLVKLNDVAENNEGEKPPEFSELLESSIKNPKIDLPENNIYDKELSRLLELKNPTDLIDYIVICAYYMLNHEKIINFTLKQLNSRLIPLGQTAVNHKMIDNVIKRGYVKIIPDLTGHSTVTEYTLVKQGEEYYSKL